MYAATAVRHADARGAISARSAATDPQRLAQFAVCALIEEAELTPKPALVDRRGPGAHRDLDFSIMLRSAQSLYPTFAALARIAARREPSRMLREAAAAIGRDGERRMLEATGGANAHRGAIWIVGLLVAGAATIARPARAREICAAAACLARIPDRWAARSDSNGAHACARFSVVGARGQAGRGFPHALRVGLPALHAARSRGIGETHARVDALLTIMASLDDTCLLHRGGRKALDVAQAGARDALRHGGSSTPTGRRALQRLDQALLACNASPGGSADLLAATIFLDRVAIG